jgi:hypothetical protein
MHPPARGSGGYKPGHISEFGHSQNYRQLLLGKADDKDNVWMHMLLLLLRDGPYSLLQAALEAREPLLQGREGWMREVQVDCMHVGACQAAKSADCIGPYCLVYGTRQLNKKMSEQYRRTCGRKRPAGSRLFQRSPWVAEARSLVRGVVTCAQPGALSGDVIRKNWLAQQAALKTVRHSLVEALEKQAANAVAAAAVHEEGQQLQGRVADAVQALANARA